MTAKTEMHPASERLTILGVVFAARTP